MADYQWSNYCEYINDASEITDIDFVLNLFHEEQSKAIEDFKRYHLKVCEIKSGNEIQKYYPGKRNEYLKELKKRGISTRQLERLTGISRSIIIKT